MDKLNRAQQIEQEIRKYKLSKIEKTENRIAEYSEVYDLIKENSLVKITKNSTSHVLRFILFLIATILLVLGIFCLFPEQIIDLIEDGGEKLSSSEKKEFNLIYPIFGYILIGLSLILGFVSVLLKKNITKRNVIFELSNLVDEVISYMSENVEEEKKKYEYFVDSIVDIGTKVAEKNQNNSEN